LGLWQHLGPSRRQFQYILGARFDLSKRFPESLATREAVMFLAYAQRWDEQLVFDLITDWRKSDRAFLQRAYGELRNPGFSIRFRVSARRRANGQVGWQLNLREIV
jgi:hypothetical protein